MRCEYHFLITRGVTLFEGFLMSWDWDVFKLIWCIFSIEIHSSINLVRNRLIYHKAAEFMWISQFALLLERLPLTLVRGETLIYAEFRSNPLYFLSSSALGCLWPYLMGLLQIQWLFFSSTANVPVVCVFSLFSSGFELSVQLMNISCPKYVNVCLISKYTFNFISIILLSFPISFT